MYPSFLQLSENTNDPLQSFLQMVKYNIFHVSIFLNLKRIFLYFCRPKNILTPDPIIYAEKIRISNYQNFSHQVEEWMPNIKLFTKYIKLQNTREQSVPLALWIFREFQRKKYKYVETHPQDKLSPWKTCVNFQTTVFCSFI